MVVAFDLLLRGGEFATIQTKQVFDDGDSVAIKLPLAKTGRDQGIVALERHAVAAIRRRKTIAIKNNCDRLFPISRSAYAQAVEKVALSLGIDRITPHVFRHTGASYCAAPPPLGRGMGEGDLSIRGRWVSLRSVSRYFKPAEIIRAQSMDSKDIKEKGSDFWASIVLF